MIEVRELSKSYGDYAVIRNLDVTFRRGELVALLGPNGAGKSTLMHCILGITPFQGRIQVDGDEVRSAGKKTRSKIGYMPQSGSLHGDLTVGDTIDFYGEFRNAGDDEKEMLLREVQLLEHIDKRVSELSGGMQQRLAFAIARLGDPQNMLLDEPSANLDRASREIMLELLRRLADEGKTIVMSTHISQELTNAADRFLSLEDGAIVDDRTAVRVEAMEA